LAAIVLDPIKCLDTEDVASAGDEFYVFSALTAGVREGSRSTATKPFSIKRGETKKFPFDQKVLFEGRCDIRGAIKGGMRAYDQDLAKDWKKYQAGVKDATVKVADLADEAGKGGIVASKVLRAAYAVFSAVATFDEDDELGELELNINAKGPAEEEKTWVLKKGRPGEYSSGSTCYVTGSCERASPDRTEVRKGCPPGPTGRIKALAPSSGQRRQPTRSTRSRRLRG
jgi:hypothetical protein